MSQPDPLSVRLRFFNRLSARTSQTRAGSLLSFPNALGRALERTVLMAIDGRRPSVTFARLRMRW